MTTAAPGKTVQRFRLDDPDVVDRLDEAHDGSVVIVDPQCDGLSPDRTEERLSNLRPAVQTLRVRGASVWFLSDRPLHCYPALAGSSVLADAESVRVKPLTPQSAVRLAVGEGVSEQSASRIAEFAAGSRALLASFVRVDLSEGSGNEKKAFAERLEREVATQAFAEIGPDLSTLMESWVFEHKLSVIEADDVPNEAILSALSTSGLLRRGSGDSYELLPFKNRDLWTDALAKWLAGVLEPPESWSKVAAELFALERDLRLELTRHFGKQYGSGWRHDCLSDLGATILELAKRDGIPAASDLNDLRAPLDWVQLSQLLDLAREEAGNSAFLGLRPFDWEKIGREVLTIRHRVAHMRLVRAGDMDVVRRARRLIAVRRSSARKVQ